MGLMIMFKDMCTGDGILYFNVKTYMFKKQTKLHKYFPSYKWKCFMKKHWEVITKKNPNIFT